MAAIGKCDKPYLRIKGGARCPEGYTLELELLRWHPAWWIACVRYAVDMGAPWWHPLVWLAIGKAIIGAPQPASLHVDFGGDG
jgi:hypothetical protein